MSLPIKWLDINILCALKSDTKKIKEFINNGIHQFQCINIFTCFLMLCQSIFSLQFVFYLYSVCIDWLFIIIPGLSNALWYSLGPYYVFQHFLERHTLVSVSMHDCHYDTYQNIFARISFRLLVWANRMNCDRYSIDEIKTLSWCAVISETVYSHQRNINCWVFYLSIPTI